ncbi:MAG: hypothetical protein ABW252_25000 [Polyangiales bacterium]
MASHLRQAFLLTLSLAACGALTCSVAPSAQAQTAPARRVSLEILVVSGGATDFGTAMVKASLDESLVPYSEIVLTDFARPRITESFLVDTSTPSVRRARFQAVVMPNEAPTQLSDAERQALVKFEQEFKIRQLDTYVYPTAAVGLNPPLQSGTLDGSVATITQAARNAEFVYLPPTLAVEDLDPKVFETYAYLTMPLANLPAGRTYTSFVEAQLPGSSVRTSVLGVLAADGREEMVLTASMNQYQIFQQALFPGILNWLTYGVHLGSEKHYFAVHIDDVFMTTGRWSDQYKCTLDEDCTGGQTGPGIRMTPEDVDFLVDWQTRQGIKLDMYFNGGAYIDAIEDEGGRFPLGQRLLIQRRQLRWGNHTYTHEVLGCSRNTKVTANTYVCNKDTRGQTLWADAKLVTDQLKLNIDWARQAGIPFDSTELVTGEHSGLRRPPVEPLDNPNIVKATNDLNILWMGSDNSVEPVQRSINGKTMTVPRYPMNIFYNVGTKVEETQEYNWLYSAKSRGGSGLCEGKFTCFEPLDVNTGFDSTIVAREARAALLHMVSNDPRIHYAHQANLAEDRVLYPVLDQLLADHRRTFLAWAVPIVNPTLAESGMEFRNRAAWSRGRSRVEAFVQNGSLVLNVWVSGTETNVPVPVTAPTDLASLTPYWGVRTGWQNLAYGRPVQIPLATTVRYAR